VQKGSEPVGTGEMLGIAAFTAGRCAAIALVLALASVGLVAPPAQAGDPVLVGAGDIGTCAGTGDAATAALVAATAGTVVTLGDNVYSSGTAAQFAGCYGPTWGRFKSRTRPAPGNHDYLTPGAAGYFGYFGAAAGPRGKGWYSYDLGAWHIIALNSNCGIVGCGPGSEQNRWLRADLAAHGAQCTLAYWHHSRFSSDYSHGNNAGVAPFWDALYQYGADVVLSAHAHDYERFAPQTPAGRADPAFGIREIVSGTGGESHYGFKAPQPNSQVRNAATFGVLKLTLHSRGYDWRFVPQPGKTFTDSGTGSCHGRPRGVVAAEAPPVETPLVDVPPVDVLTADVPPADVPTADAPPADAPPADASTVDVPPVDVPTVDVPPVDVPPVDVPPADVPPADASMAVAVPD